MFGNLIAVMPVFVIALAYCCVLEGSACNAALGRTEVTVL